MRIANIRDTAFRTGLQRLAEAGRIRTFHGSASSELQIASYMKALDGAEALYFPKVDDTPIPLIANLLCSAKNCEAAFGMDFRELRESITSALETPIAPEEVRRAPIHDVILTNDIDIAKTVPALKHAPGDIGRYITAGVVVVKDPETGVYNASYHRLKIHGPDRLGIKLDFGRHLRRTFERATALGTKLDVAICIGTDLSLHLAAATMGSQLPEDVSELAVAGGIIERPLAVTQAQTLDMLVPAEAEYVIEGTITPGDEAPEGPFGEFIGFAAPEAPAPVVQITAITHRDNPIYHAINGFGRETIVLRKYVLEASLLKVLNAAAPIVTDAEMTAGGLHRFHAILQVAKTSSQHDGLERNAILAAFGALKDLDMIIVVDDDIDIRDPEDVEYALATRMEASRDLFIIPRARGHEYVRVSDQGIRAKVGIDATVPYADRATYQRVAFADIDIGDDDFKADGSELLARLQGGVAISSAPRGGARPKAKPGKT